ncbi:MAG: hypothetical protein ACLUVX_09170 [Lachnospira pectinoschiza]
MLIDTQRIEDFLKTHSCHITNKGQTLEDNITYADFATNRYESVFEQLQTDIEVEKAYDALEDVLFVENKDGDLVLAKPYEFTINEKIYSYEAGTPREPIWEDMFKLHSKGAEFTYSTEYEDANYETVERNNNKETPYINILNNQDLKKKYDSGEIRIPDNIMSKYMNGKTVFVIDNEKERDILAYNIARFPYTGIIPEYNSNNPYWFKSNDIACGNFMAIPFELRFMLYTDFSIILEQSKYESMCFKDKKIAEYGYEFNDGDQIWSDTAEIYKTDNDNLFIKKYETGYTNEVKYSAISLNNLIEEIQQFKKDNGKDRRGGCFIIKDLPNEYYKANINSYIKNFCDGTIVIKINSQEELDILLSQLQDKDVQAPAYIHYNSKFPYFYIDRISGRLKANHNFNNINSVHCIEHCYNFSDLIDKDKQDNK